MKRRGDASDIEIFLLPEKSIVYYYAYHTLIYSQFHLSLPPTKALFQTKLSMSITTINS